MPDMPGICTSVITQSVPSTAFELTNASADGNAAAEYPRERVKLIVAWRNDSSSSTIAITGVCGTWSLDVKVTKRNAQICALAASKVLHQGIGLRFCASKFKQIRH